MAIFHEDTEFTDVGMVERVVNLFQSNSHMQRIVRLGLLANMSLDDDLEFTDEDDIELDHWGRRHSNAHGYSRHSDMTHRGFRGNRMSPPNSIFLHSRHHIFLPSVFELPHQPSVKVEPAESDTERRARVLQETKKSKEKAEKKRIKKQKQKERKRLEKLKKEQQNPPKNEEVKEDSEQCKVAETKQVNDKSTKEGASVKESPSSRVTDSSGSSEEESSDEESETKNHSGDSEELDLTSSFVSKAALIVKRKLEQKPRIERKEKKKIPVKEETRPVSVNINEEQAGDEKDAAISSSPTYEDNVKISTELAVLGNKFASAGEFDMAVKYFTDAIKYNPTEYKLFGNRSFCFEKMQEYEKALIDATLSLSMFPGWVKGLYRKGRALAGLKRYEEAAQAFREVLKLESSCADAAQELMRVQIIQLMEHGYTREQSSNALIIHGTVDEALKVLSKLNHTSGGSHNDAYPARSTLPPAQVVNISGVSPVLSANANPAQTQEAPKTPLKNKPLGPVQNMPNVHSQPKPISNQVMKTSNQDHQTPPELFPVWVGNLVYSVTESMITNVFSRAGVVFSVKLLMARRCAFVNYTKQEYCDEAIRLFHGFELCGNNIAVRYPDRIPRGMGISKSALKADYLQDENLRQNECDGRNAGGNGRPVWPYRPAYDNRGIHKQ
ncbi:hypothetical protein LDENG_00188400 [Lucifuga dentata]|nr:hypothetical protein LDENG_00188400 [Lucifuga dentata]